MSTIDKWETIIGRQNLRATINNEETSPSLSEAILDVSGMLEDSAQEELKENMEKNKDQESKTKEYLVNGGNFFPNLVAERAEILPAGVYECAVTREGAPYFRPITILTDKIINLQDTASTEITAEIKNFWSEGISDKFEQYGLVHKRGILLHGPPGTGKTISLAKCARMVVNELQGIALFNPDPGTLKEYLRLIKEIEPTKKVLVMWEEFDGMLRSAESELLSLLDGETQVSNIVYLATTNYISRIPARIKNRPSRFARIVEVGVPSEQVRRDYLNAKLHESDKHKMDGLIQYSEGFVIDQLKDLIISHCIFGHGIAESSAKIKEMIAEAVGVDDYNEEQVKSVFSTLGAGEKPKSPLQPIR